MEFGKLFPSPTVEEIAGQRVEFPPLKSKELATLTAVIRADRVDVAKRNATAESLNPVQTYQARVQAENRKVSVTDILDRIMEIAGSEHVIRLSLAKAGHTPESVDRVLDLMSLPQQGEIALKIARVAAPLPMEPLTDEVNRPLATGAVGAPSEIGSKLTQTSDTRSELTPAS